MGIGINENISRMVTTHNEEEKMMKTFQEWSQDQCNEARWELDREIVLRRVIDGLKKGYGTDNIKDLEGVTFTDENLRAPLPETGEPHQGQGANLDDETIKAAKALGILVKGDQGHWKLVAAEDWRVRGSNYEQPFGGEDEQAGSMAGWANRSLAWSRAEDRSRASQDRRDSQGPGGRGTRGNYKY